MTTDETYAEIGKMHVRAKELRRSISCLENKKARMEADARGLAGFLSSSHVAVEASGAVLHARRETEGEPEIYQVRFHAAAEVHRVLSKLEEEKRELRDVAKRLDEC